VADQRYCLNCGKPCSPVRLAFLDALTPDTGRGQAPPVWGGQGMIEMGPSGLLPVEAGHGTNAWLRRNSGLLALLAILLMCIGIGLLVGHWASNKTAPAGPSVIKVEGLGGLAAGGTSTGTSTTPSAGESTTKASKSSSKTEAKEAAEGEKETKAEKAPPPKPVTITKSKLSKLTKSTGRKHQEEINRLGDTPIETG
jgi:hypothetical protein